MKSNFSGSTKFPGFSADTRISACIHNDALNEAYHRVVPSRLWLRLDVVRNCECMLLRALPLNLFCDPLPS